ncbi:MAG: dTMP kinase [Candidatus Altiarchaeota archaeon]|nr:dTMP kinase [Candidatus Altiarchaeota archaeon]
MDKKAFFVSFEGIDGSGKTTLLSELGKLLENQKEHTYHVTSFDKTEVYGLIKSYTVEKKSIISPRALQVLYYAARVDHHENELKDALKSYDLVLMDRYVDSTYAYCDPSDRKYLKNLNGSLPSPDLRVLISVPVSEALRRVDGRNSKKSIFEDPMTLENVSNSYHEIFEEYVCDGNGIIIDGLNKNPDFLAEEILGLVSEKIKGYNSFQSHYTGVKTALNS